MALSHRAATFEVLDALDVQTLALFVTTDDRPLRGLAGRVDWRLCGGLSATLQGGSFRGELGERLLMPTQGRIGAARLLVFGCGSASRPLALEAFAACLASARKAGADELALELPAALEGDALAVLRAHGGRRLVVLGADEALQARIDGARASS